MLTVNLVSLGTVSYGPSITLIGHIGRADGPAPPVDPAELVIPWQDLPDNPSELALLSWHASISDFRGRAAEQSELETWATSNPAVSIKFVTGEGGSGKSRLAAEFARGLQAHDWAAGFVDLRKPFSFFGKSSGTLLIVDYPEEDRAGVVELLRDCAELDRRNRFRVLFLTRQPIDSWLELIHDSRAEVIVDMMPIVVGRLDDRAAHEIFSSAQEQVSTILGSVPLPVSEEALTDWLRQEPENQRTLFIVAAAIYSALQPNEEVVGYKGRVIIQALVDRELARLRNTARGQGLGDHYALARLLALAAIAGDLPASAIRKVARETHQQLGLPEGRDPVLLLQQAGLVSDRSLKAIKPDIVAANLLVSVLSREPGFAGDLTWAALAHDIAGGLVRFARLSYDAEVVLGLSRYPLSEWLAEAVHGRADRCAGIEPFLFEPQIPLGWIPAAAEVCRTLLEHAVEPVERARLLNNLGNRLSELGQREEALTATREAVEIRRQLAAARPEAFLPDLATSLNNLGTMLSELGQREEALTATREAVETYRQLAAARPDRFTPDLARSLGVLGSVFAKLRRFGEAVDAFREGANRIRPYAERWPNSGVSRLLEALEADLRRAEDEAGP